MKAIQVRFLPVTNTRDARLKAFIYGGKSLTIPAPDDLEGQEQAQVAAVKLAKELGWIHWELDGFAGGCLPNGDYCFVGLNEVHTCAE